MKNLLIIHLESLNYNNYNLNKDLFVFLSEFEKKCILFTNYFSTATSTLMVIGDLLYGGMDQYEKSTTLDDIPKSYLYSSTLFDELKEKGYRTGIYVFPDGNNRESAEKKHLAGFNNSMVLKSDYDEYIRAMDLVTEEQPFALMGCNYISNSSFNKYADSSLCNNSFDRWKKGYEALDKSVKDLINLLQDKELLESTVIVLYGDHGDDYFTHGLKHGMTHAIEPNALLIHTPLLVYDPDLIKCSHVEHGLLETTDLREMIWNAVMGYDWIEKWKETSKEVIYSRSAYAAQPIGSTHYYKGYSISDGIFLLCVTQDGMEMYHIRMDADCHNNLLARFNYDGGIIRDDFIEEEYRQYSDWEWGIFGYNSRCHIRQKFYYLRRKLYEKTLHSYIAGNRDETAMLEEMRFDLINK